MMNNKDDFHTVSDNMSNQEIENILHTNIKPAAEILITDEWH